MLEVRNLCVRHGNVTAVEAASFDIRRGEIVSLIGANGAGKSSVLMAISGMVRAASGHISFDGKDLLRATPHAIAGLGIVQVPEGRMIFSGLSVRENLEIGGHRLPRHKLQRRLEETIVRFPVLGDRLDQSAAGLSGGQLQLLAVARGVMADPRLLMLDEPTLGLAPIAAREVLSVVADLRNSGMTILLVEQNVRQALKIADRAYVMEAGKTTLSGESRDLMGDGRVVSAFLGIHEKPVDLERPKGGTDG